ncbi:DUF1304 domain-containing protein [Halopseudomonas pelagia]|uniref:DUF1304 domain-containing protein n=1 Tax=Halopseudomonas pelagia TaxID=553151 RepID=UPI0003A0989D|nr:DUF1304 domain-containing protein [Halopseudomonas pelagia]|tara:strand:+ start:1624 stop:2010 length:387 start_codon:yes stop_codon:yes gene_type:complete
MHFSTQLLAFVAAALHVLIFCMESLWFMKPQVHKRFGAATPADAEARRLFAFNQGFYNLFLALGIVFGLVLLYWPSSLVVGQTLVLFCCACMLGAAVVLFISGGLRMLRAAVMQGVFPLLALITWLGF